MSVKETDNKTTAVIKGEPYAIANATFTIRLTLFVKCLRHIHRLNKNVNTNEWAVSPEGASEGVVTCNNRMICQKLVNYGKKRALNYRTRDKLRVDRGD